MARKSASRQSLAWRVAMIAVVVLSCCPRSRAADNPFAVRQIKVLPDKAPDCSSLKSIVETVTRGCKTNDEKAIAIYNFMQLTHYHFAYPSEPGGLSALKEINCYGWSLCGGLHSVESALWRQLGWGWRFVGWDGHTTVEANYDGRWHYLDVFLKFYAWMPDKSAHGGRTIAGEDDLAASPRQLIQDAFVLDPARKCVYMKANRFARQGDEVHWQAPSFLSCGDEIKGVIDGLKTHHRAGAEDGWAGITHADLGYSADVDLAPGFALTNTWDPEVDAWYWGNSKKPPAHTCGGHKDTRNDPGVGMVLEPYIKSKPARSYANGKLQFSADFTSDAVLQSFVSVANVRYAERSLQPAKAGRPGVVVVELASPYIMTSAGGDVEGADTVELSVDKGRTYQPIHSRDFSALVRGQLAAQVRITFEHALTAVKLEAVVQNNSGSLPYLSPGRNLVTVSAADSTALGRSRLVVTYAYRLGNRKKSFDQMYAEDKEVAKGHDAYWDDKITCVQKTFAAADLPATFTIDCPTPKGKFPVYPRMLFVRREVLAPGQTPLATPAPPSNPIVGPSEGLATLPNPLSIGATSLQ